MIGMFRRVVENTSLNHLYTSQAVFLSTCASIAAFLTVIAAGGVPTSSVAS